MGRNRKKSGAGAVAPVTTSGIDVLMGEYDQSPRQTQIIANYLSTVPPSAIDRAFNRSDVRVDFENELDSNNLLNLRFDTNRSREAGTGYVGSSEQDVYNDFVRELEAAQRDDSSWDANALINLSRTDLESWGDDYGRYFNQTEAYSAMREIQQLILRSLTAASALANLGVPYQVDGSTLVFPNGRRAPLEPISNRMYTR